jgi:hypothetical protein
MTKGRNFISNLLLVELWLSDDTFDSILRIATFGPLQHWTPERRVRPAYRMFSGTQGQLPGSRVTGSLGTGLCYLSSVYNVGTKTWIAASEPVDDIEEGKRKAEAYAKVHLQNLNLQLPPLKWKESRSA